jgi:predicted DsbA family dithiol-disulfide isomerase
MTRSSVSVEVVSDVACPWCFLGKRRLERAVALLPDLDVAIHWRPYRLDPTIPPEGMDRRDYVARKFGSLDALDSAHARLEEFGRAEGIDYRFDLITRSADTTDAHRLVRWANESGLEDAMVERLFAAYFSEGQDIGDKTILARLADDVGLQPVAIAKRLTSDEDRSVVEAEIDAVYRIGVSGVPTFIIDGRYGIVGAHPAETIASGIRQAATERARTAAAS